MAKVLMLTDPGERLTLRRTILPTSHDSTSDGVTVSRNTANRQPIIGRAHSKVQTVDSRFNGKVVLITGAAGGIGRALAAPYVASKHAVLGLMKTAALEGADANVRVNAVNPGPVETRMMRSIEAATGAGDLARSRTMQGIPLNRLGQPDEVAAMVAFLSSDEAGFATGGAYVIDGGLLAGRGRGG